MELWNLNWRLLEGYFQYAEWFASEQNISSLFQELVETKNWENQAQSYENHLHTTRQRSIELILLFSQHANLDDEGSTPEVLKLDTQRSKSYF